MLARTPRTATPHTTRPRPRPVVVACAASSSASTAPDMRTNTPPPARLLLIGATGVTGRSALDGLLSSPIASGAAPLQAYALTRNTGSPAAAAMAQRGVTAVQADLDDTASLSAALAGDALRSGLDLVYIHALSTDAASADPQEVVRAERLASALAATPGIRLVVYNSAGGRGKLSGISQAEQKHKVEDILSAAGLPLLALQATLFMEELWKRYTRPGLLEGKFTWSTPRDKPIQLLAARDMGLAAGHAFADPQAFAGRAIELAGDALTPAQMCDAFSAAQGGMPVKLSSPPTWPLWILSRDLWRIIRFLSDVGYSADVEACRAQFPGLHTFPEFLAATGWADRTRTYEQGISYDGGSARGSAAPLPPK